MSLFTRNNDAAGDGLKRERLAQLETAIAARLQHFIAAGEALCSIRDEQLYLLTHRTFEEYVEIRWSLSARRAYQLIGGAKKAQELTAAVTTGTTTAERVNELPIELQSEVRETINGRRPKASKRKRKPKAIRIRVPGAVVIIERRTADVDPAAALAAAAATFTRQAEAA